jgi:hypothetical protein
MHLSNVLLSTLTVMAGVAYSEVHYDGKIEVVPPSVNCRQDAIDWCKNYVTNKPNKNDQNPAFSVEDCNNVMSIDEPWQCEW